jgi:hypothetical protein
VSTSFCVVELGVELCVAPKMNRFVVHAPQTSASLVATTAQRVAEVPAAMRQLHPQALACAQASAHKAAPDASRWARPAK